ncbi:MAG: glycosyltransferase [Ardenticatenaceae bacterium]
MKAVVITPTYNEAENIGRLIPQVLAQDSCLEVLVVDDNSPDGTGHIADEMAADEPRIHVLHRTQKEGLGPAYIAGFKWALDYGAEVLIQMDADLSHDPNRLPAFLSAIEENDVVLGSRYTEGGGTQNWPWHRQLLSRGASLYTRAILGTKIKDMTGGFKCFRREVLERLDLDRLKTKGYSFLVELTYRAVQAGFRVREIPITFVDRQYGQSKMSSNIIFEAMGLVLKLRFGSDPALKSTRRPMKILLVISEAPPIRSGIARVAGELQAGLEARGHQVDILSSLDIPRYHFGEVRLSSFIFHWSEVRQKLAHYDLINVHVPVPTFADLFLLLATQFGRHHRKGRIIMTYQFDLELQGAIADPLSRLYNWFQKKMARMVGHTIVTTPSYAKMFEGIVPADKLSIIPWAVNQEAFGASIAEKPSDRLRVLFIGQLRPYKGLDILLRGMAGLPGVQLNVIGGGHQAQSYRQMAEELNLRNVAFLGKVRDSELQAALKESHILVLPSRSKLEGFGIVLLEAMAAGCVPISSALPGVRDVVGQVGFTFPVGDSNALRQLLSYLRDHSDVVERYAHQAQAKARRYTWERAALAHEQLFRQIIVTEELRAALKSRKRYEIACLETLSTHLQAFSSVLYQGSPHADQLEQRIIYGEPFASPKQAISQKGVLGFAVEQERTMLLPDDVKDTYLAHALGALADRSTLLTSILLPEQKQTLFCFTRAAEEQPFTPADRRWLENMAALLTPKREEKDHM